MGKGTVGLEGFLSCLMDPKEGAGFHLTAPVRWGPSTALLWGRASWHWNTCCQTLFPCSHSGHLGILSTCPKGPE